MELHAIQAMPRPRIKRTFNPGEIVVSKFDDARVQVTKAGRKYFAGKLIQNDARFTFHSNCWRVVDFSREPD